jgi:hypothetical protein
MVVDTTVVAAVAGAGPIPAPPGWEEAAAGLEIDRDAVL